MMSQYEPHQDHNHHHHHQHQQPAPHHFHAPPHVIETEIELFLDNFKYVTSLLNSEFSVLDCQRLSNYADGDASDFVVPVFGPPTSPGLQLGGPPGSSAAASLLASSSPFNRLSWPDYDSSTVSVSGPKHSVTTSSDANRNSVASSSMLSSTDLTSFEFDPDPPPGGVQSHQQQLRRALSGCLEDADDLMAEPGNCTLTIIDVVDALQANYAFISGGKSRCFCHIVTFPECPSASAITEEQYKNVVTYLTNIPPLHDADIGFVVIVDRRQDKWGSIKTLLLRMSGYFPALVQKVYVLRPSSFLQKAFADISFKFLAEDFKAKVLVLNSVEELHGFVDRDQLTVDLGGSLEYNHREWIQHRAALEKFSGNASEIAGRLRQLCVRLQDTQFPNDVKQTESLIAEHNVARLEVQQDLEAVVKHGEALLMCFKTVRNHDVVDDTDSLEENSDMVVPTEFLPICRISHVTAVERLLIQLDETVSNFESFWKCHRHRLEQCLQLRNFEEQFRQLHITMEQYLTSLRKFDEQIAESAEDVERMVTELDEFESNSKLDIEHASELKECGERFIEASHYAVDCIRPKCAELEHICSEYNNLVQGRHQKLEMARQLYYAVDKLNAWSTRGRYLLVPLTDGKQLSDDDLQSPAAEMKSAEAVLQLTDAELHFILGGLTALLDETEDFKADEFTDLDTEDDSLLSSTQLTMLKTAIVRFQHVRQQCCKHRDRVKHLINKSIRHESNSVNDRISDEHLSPSDVTTTVQDKQIHVMKELLDTEFVYVEELSSILKGYLWQIDNPELQHLVPEKLKVNKYVLFGNLEDICNFHSNIFLKELERCCTTLSSLGHCFVARSSEFQLYSSYCQNMMASEQLLQDLGDDNAFLQECQRRLEHRLPLRAYLLKPVQRITKYQLLLKEMLKYCEGGPVCTDLEQALAAMLSVVKHVNDLMHQISIRGFQEDISALGRLLMQGSFSVWAEHRWDRLRELRFKPMCRHVFLYEQAVLFCKKKEDANNGNSVVYLYKNSLKTADIGLTELVKGDRRKFEVWLRGRTEVYILQASTVEMKDVWLSEFKKVLQNQFEEIREGRRTKHTTHHNASFNKPLVLTSAGHGTNGVDEVDSSSNQRRGSDTDMKTHVATGLPAWEICRSPTVDVYISAMDSEASEKEKTLSATSFYVASSNHVAASTSELSLQEGQLVQLMAVGRDGRWFVRSVVSKEEGWVPVQCLESAKRHSTHSLQFLMSSTGKTPDEDSVA